MDMKRILSGAFAFFLLLTVTPQMAAAEQRPTEISPVNVRYNEEGLFGLFEPVTAQAETPPQKVIAEYSYEQYQDELGDFNVTLDLTLRYGDGAISLHSTGIIVHSKRTENLGVWSGPLEAEFDVRGETYFAMIGFNKFDGVDGVHFTASIAPPEGSGDEYIMLDFGDDIAMPEIVQETRVAIDRTIQNRANDGDMAVFAPNEHLPTGFQFWIAICKAIASEMICKP